MGSNELKNWVSGQEERLENCWAELGRVVSDPAVAPAEREQLERVGGIVLAAIGEGLPYRALQRVAVVSDAGTLTLTAKEQESREGPYPHYTRGFACSFIDDYAMKHDALLVGCQGDIALHTGKLVVVRARGRFSHSENYLTVECEDAVRDYLGWALGSLDAVLLATGPSACRSIDRRALQAALVPWPSEELRDAFVKALLLCERVGADRLKLQLESSWATAPRIGEVDAGALAKGAEPAAAQGGTPGRPCDGDALEGPLLLIDGLLDVLSRELSLDASAPFDVVGATGSLEEGLPEKSCLVVCFPETNQGAWTSRPVDAEDPRWVLGAPPRNRANYAWIQQAIAAMGDRSLALMLLSNAALHTSIGREGPLRTAWVESGLVKAVIALPGGIFPDGRVPSSLVIMGKGLLDGDEVLLVNALGLGEDCLESCPELPRRILPDAVIADIVETVAAWARGERGVTRPGFCRGVPIAALLAEGGNLSPWKYV